MRHKKSSNPARVPRKRAKIVSQNTHSPPTNLNIHSVCGRPRKLLQVAAPAEDSGIQDTNTSSPSSPPATPPLEHTELTPSASKSSSLSVMNEAAALTE